MDLFLVSDVYVCVSLSRNTNLFPQQLRLRGPARPRLPPQRPLLSFAEETGTEKWNSAASAGKFPPYGFLRIGIYVLGFCGCTSFTVNVGKMMPVVSVSWNGLLNHVR